MLTRNWKVWLGVLVALIGVGGGLTLLLHFQGAVVVSRWVAQGFAVLAAAWVCWGLWVWRETPWVRQANVIVLTSLGFGLSIATAYAIGWGVGVRTFAYIYAAVMGFMVGINLIRLALRPSWPIIGVARTMIEEAIRMRVALIFILMLLVMLPILPLILGSEDRVTYVVQRFLTYSMMVVAALLSVMTVMLAARSVSQELESKQIFMTLTKPISRWQYLLGKWLGIALLNLVLVSVSGITIYGFTMALAQGPAMNRADRVVLNREVLTARQGIEPQPADRNTSFAQIVFNLLEYKRLTDADRYGSPGSPTASLPMDVRQEVRAEALTNWLTIQPGQSKTFRFSGLGDAAAASQQAEQQITKELRDLGLTQEQAEEFLRVASRQQAYLSFPTPQGFSDELEERLNQLREQHAITLVISPDTSPAPSDDMVELVLRINGVPWPVPQTPTAAVVPQRMAIETPQEISMPATLINDAGELMLTIEVPRQKSNGAEQNAIQLNGKDATVEVFYRTGSFAGNLAKAMGVMWVRLLFLAALGLAAGALLSFPVATLLCLTLLVLSVFSAYVTEAVTSYASLPQTDTTRDLVSAWTDRFGQHISNGEMFEALKLIVRLIASGVLYLIPSISDYSTNPFLSEGRQIPRQLLIDVVWKMGLLWTSITGLIGALLFQRRELAKVVVS